ncbi:MAG: aldo/keto reductase [Candidatus Glassbacteria bacterium]|nr:aldo/keto reductase [Candidatus Glassbacteria bacterium]
MPRRPLGRTGEYLSIIGMGGIVVMDEEQGHADRVVREAFEAGVNYFDVAPTYGDAELKLGPALEPFRKKVFLACKTAERDRQGSQKELDESLKHLRTDYLDLYQLHSIETREDVQQAFGPDGAMETFIEARRQGKVRFLGFSAHSVEAALAAMDNFDFDTVLLPVNAGCWLKGNFGPQVVEKAVEKKMGILALKAGARSLLADRKKKVRPKCWYHPLLDEAGIAASYNFTLSLPVTAALPPGDEGLFRLALKAAPNFIPVSGKDKEELEKWASALDPLFEYPAWES